MDAHKFLAESGHIASAFEVLVARWRLRLRNELQLPSFVA
jgi:hypothetical protein